MNIERLFVIFTTWNMRLPYWFIAMVIVAFVVLSIILLVMWKKMVRYNRLYNTANNSLKKTMNEILDITLKYNAKEEEIVKLKKIIATNSREQDNLIKDLKRKISRQGTSISENIIKLQVRESEKLDLLSKLKAKEENIEQLNKFQTLAKEETQKLEKERERLKRQMKDTQDVLNQKIHQLEDIEEKCNQVEYHNQTLENSKKLLEKEINELKAALVEQENSYKSEIRNLSLELGRRNENIEKLNDSLDEMKKILQTVRDEKALVEIKFQEIQKTQIGKGQDEYTDMNKNLIEKIARW